MWVADRGQLHTLVVDQVDSLVFLQPAVLDRLPIQGRARVRRGEGHLNRVGIDLLGKVDGFFDRLRGFAWQSEDERAMDKDAEFAAVLCETPCDVGSKSLPDVMQDLIVTRFVADQ